MDKAAIREKEFLGSGWAFPVTFSAGNNLLSLSKYEENINQMIHIILQTTFGERPFQPQFGSGLQQYFFREMNTTLQGEIRETVKSALLDNEPRITVKEVVVEFADEVSGLVEITIHYEYNRTNTRHNYVYPFHLKEGTNLRQ